SASSAPTPRAPSRATSARWRTTPTEPRASSNVIPLHELGMHLAASRDDLRTSSKAVSTGERRGNPTKEQHVQKNQNQQGQQPSRQDRDSSQSRQQSQQSPPGGQ